MGLETQVCLLCRCPWVSDTSVETAAEVASPGEVAPRVSPLATSPLLRGGGGGGASLLDALAAVFGLMMILQRMGLLSGASFLSCKP